MRLSPRWRWFTSCSDRGIFLSFILCTPAEAEPSSEPAASSKAVFIVKMLQKSMMSGSAVTMIQSKRFVDGEGMESAGGWGSCCARLFVMHRCRVQVPATCQRQGIPSIIFTTAFGSTRPLLKNTKAVSLRPTDTSNRRVQSQVTKRPPNWWVI